jgi:hypothetical protein
VPNFFFSSSSISRSNACKWKKDLEPKYHKRKKLLRHEGNCMSVIYKEIFFVDAGKGEGLWVLHTISAFLSASPTLYSSDPVTSISSTNKFYQISLVHSKAKANSLVFFSSFVRPKHIFKIKVNQIKFICKHKFPLWNKVNFPWHFCCAYVLENREKSKEQHLKFLPVLLTYSRV